MDIINIPIEEEVKQAYIDYAMSVIVGRAIPDVRDGLKPVQRRILYAMYEMGLYPDKPFKKSARIVGECFVKGTKVATLSGIKNIEEIEKGEFVYTSRGLKKVTELYIMPPQPVKEIVTDTGISVRCTPGQKFKVLTEEGKLIWKEAKELKEGDVLLLRSVFPAIDKKIKIENVEIDGELSYLLGLFVGDGWIENERRGYIRLGIFLSDERVRERVENILASKGFSFSRLENGTIRLDSASSRIFMKILGYDASVTASTKRVPEWLFRAEKGAVLSFISGIVDSDGCVHRKRNVVNISSVSVDLIKDLQILLFFLGIPSQLYKYKAKGGRIGDRKIKANYDLYCLEISGIYVSELLKAPVRAIKYEHICGEKVYKRVKADLIPYIGKLLIEEFSQKHLGGEWYLNTEGKKVRSGLKYPSGTKIRYHLELEDNFNVYKASLLDFNILEKVELIGSEYAEILKGAVENNWFFFKVKKIADLLPEITYDIQVEEEHEFLANGFVVHNCLGKYHPHGDQAVYDALVRMAQDFNMRYPLVIGQGNFGSIDGDPPAAMRYSEAKLSKLAMEMLEDIDKETVDFVPNFDDSLTEPVVLPSKFPNLLCNGTTGIAVGLATSIPPHNLREVGKALIKLAENPKTPLEEILQIIKGPDFPTGGIIENAKDLKEVYEYGRGTVQLKAKAHIEKLQGNREQIVVTEIPYQVNKADLIKKIADLVRSGRLKEISDLRDESDKEGVRIVIELKREAKGEKVLEKLYRYTQLKKNFPVNLVVLIDGEPKLVGLKRLLQEFIRHRLEIILRRTKYYLKKAEHRLHIVKGLLIAIGDLDNVIDMIRKSKDVPEAKEKLITTYGLSEIQAQAVLDLRLQRLTSLEREKLQKEEKELEEKIAYYKKVIAEEKERVNIFIEETKELIKKHGDARKTFVEGLEESLEEGSLMVAILENGQVLPLEELPEETPPVVNVLDVPFTEGLFLVSNRGRVYWIAGSHALQGTKIRMKEPGEKIIGAFIREQFADRLIMATKKGYVKRIPLVDFEYKAQGMSIIKLTEGDEVISIAQSYHDADILIYTRKGRTARFPVNEVPPATPGTRGVQGMKVEKDEVVGARILREEPYLLVITSSGRIKKIYSGEINRMGRYVKGVHVLPSGTRDKLADIIPFKDKLELLITTKGGKLFYDLIEEKDIILSKRDSAPLKRWDIGDDEIHKVVKKSS